MNLRPKALLPPLLSLVGFAFLGFVAGNYSYYNTSAVSQYMKDAFDAAGALYEKYSYTGDDGVAVSTLDAKTQVSHAVIQWDKEAVKGGYTLLSMHYSCDVFLVDLEGHVVHTWSMPFSKAWPTHPHVPFPVGENTIGIEKAKLFPNGDLLVLYTGEGDTPWGYGLAKIDRDSHVLWTYDANTHHDFYVDKGNGDIYTLTHAWMRTPIEGLESLTYPLLQDYIVVLSSAGKELSKTPLMEVFRDSAYASMMMPITGQNWDVLHTNSIMKLEPAIAKQFPMFNAGDVLISMREISSLAVIDLKTRKIKWFFSGGFKGQHSAAFMPDGHILMYDNLGLFENNAYVSRAAHVDPKTMKISTVYRGDEGQPLLSEFYGRVQPLDNGDILITSPMNNKVFEIDPKGRTVWEMKLNDVVQFAKRYEPKDVTFISGTEAK